MDPKINLQQNIELRTSIVTSLDQILDILSFKLYKQRFDRLKAIEIFNELNEDQQALLAEWIIEDNREAGKLSMHIILRALNISVSSSSENVLDFIYRNVSIYIEQRKLQERERASANTTSESTGFSRDKKLYSQVAAGHIAKRTKERVEKYFDALSKLLENDFKYDINGLTAEELEQLINYLVELGDTNKFFKSAVNKIFNNPDSNDIARKIHFLKGSLQNLHEILGLSSVRDYASKRAENADGYTKSEQGYIDSLNWSES